MATFGVGGGGGGGGGVGGGGGGKGGGGNGTMFQLRRLGAVPLRLVLGEFYTMTAT